MRCAKDVCQEFIRHGLNALHRLMGMLVQNISSLQNRKQKEQRKNITAYAYVDGSYNKYTKTYGYGGIINDGTKEHEIMGSGANPEMASMRNVAGEIEGAMAAISYAEQNGIQELTIYYDYIGIENWPTGKWNANQKGTQLYRDYVRNAKIKIYFKKVKGHSGVRGNEKADMLAKRAVGVV